MKLRVYISFCVNFDHLQEFQSFPRIFKHFHEFFSIFQRYPSFCLEISSIFDTFPPFPRNAPIIRIKSRLHRIHPGTRRPRTTWLKSKLCTPKRQRRGFPRRDRNHRNSDVPHARQLRLKNRTTEQNKPPIFNKFYHRFTREFKRTHGLRNRRFGSFRAARFLHICHM